MFVINSKKENLKVPKVIKLNEALLCLDCNRVFEKINSNLECPYCGNKSVYYISKWLNRE